MTGRAQRPFPDLRNQAGILGNRNELGRRHPAARRMLPAQQRLEPGDPFGRGVDHRLIVQFQPAMRQRIAQVLFQQAAFLGIAVEVGGIEMMPSAPAVLGGIERKVGVADQRFGRHAIIRRQGDPHRCANDNAMPLDRVRLR